MVHHILAHNGQQMSQAWHTEAHKYDSYKGGPIFDPLEQELLVNLLFPKRN
jgi:hypothetical protein